MMINNCLMPDYYPDFHCKMGNCRSSCCEGWRVSLSEDEYFRLLGMECSDDIRRRLDCAMHLSEGGGEDRYAEMCHDYTGNCKMRMEDGRCLIQAEMGEESLPLICKLYPRAYRLEGNHECSCAASCEGVTEMLFFRRKPLEFINRKPEFDLPAPKEATDFAEKIPDEQKLRLFFIGIAQDRRFPLYFRLYRLGIAVNTVMSFLDDGKMPDTEEILTRLPASVPSDIPKGADTLRVAVKIVGDICAHGSAVKEYGERITEYFSGEGALDRFIASAEKLKSEFSFCEEGFENLIVNHLFFTRFPFADGLRDENDGLLTVGAVYTALRLLAMGSLSLWDSDERLIDVLAAAFRLIEHTPFHPYAVALLRREHTDTREKLLALMSL